MARVAPVSFQNTAAGVLAVLAQHIRDVREDGAHHSSTMHARLSFRVPGRVCETTLAAAVQAVEALRNESYRVGDVEWKCVAEGVSEAFLYVHLAPLFGATRKRARAAAHDEEDEDPFLDCDDEDEDEAVEEETTQQDTDTEGAVAHPLIDWARGRLSLARERLRPVVAAVMQSGSAPPQAAGKARKTRRAARREIVDRMHALALRGHEELQDAASRVPADTQSVASQCNVPVRAYFRFQLMIEALHAVLWGACRDARRPMCRAWPRWQLDAAMPDAPDAADYDEDRQCRCLDLVPPAEGLCMSVPLLLRVGMSHLRNQSYARPYRFTLTFGPTTVRFSITHTRCPLHQAPTRPESCAPRAPGFGGAVA